MFTATVEPGSVIATDLWVLSAVDRFEVANLVDLMLNFYCFASVGHSKSTRERLKRSFISYSKQLTIGFVLRVKLRFRDSIAL